MPGRARTAEQALILAEALARVRRGGPRAVAVFDLDSTLLDNRPRQARILRDYGAAAGLPALAAAHAGHVVSWELGDQLRAAGLSAAEALRHRAPLRRFWAERFFTSPYARLDVPVPGAAAFVGAAREAGARVVYLTGRPRRMEDGTREVLARFGFPVPDGATTFLLLRPEAIDGDDAWKDAARPLVDRLGTVVTAFDNEPAHVNGHARAWPAAWVVHLDTDHSGRPIEVLASVPSVRSLLLPGLPVRLAEGLGAAPAP